MASLQSSGRGVFFDSAALKIYAADAGPSIAANKASFMALFGGMVQINGSRLIIDGNITFDGTEFIAREERARSRRFCASRERAMGSRYRRRYNGNFEPNINDTGLDGIVSSSWNVGCSTGKTLHPS